MPRGTFAAKVLAAVRRIPAGRVATYGDIAALAGSPRAHRAVGTVMRECRDPGVPCHRVIAAGGALGGYGRFLQLKRDLLRAEGLTVSATRVRNFTAVRWQGRRLSGVRARASRTVWATLVLVLSWTAASVAQQTGTLSGRIVDQTGGALPGVTVTVEPAGTATPIETVSDDTGQFHVPAVPAGRVAVTFRLINFSTVRRDVTVTTGSTRVDAVLVVAASADIVITAPRTFRNLAEIEKPAENLVGIASAASEGAITAAQLAVRPANRAAEILEAVPGLVISQHSGEGKANQYYLRGFNLDHGFDFAQTIAGLPVNLPTHAHAQGYADANFLIPELVSGVQFRKGPYFAENGDFSSAGSATINYFNVLERPVATATIGSFGYDRVFVAASPRVGAGHVLAAGEWERDNGPWANPNDKDKLNTVLRYSRGDSRTGVSLTWLGYSNHWHSTDQIPLRAVQSGRLGRFGAIEPTDGGETFRYAVIADGQRSSTNGSTRATAYVQRYGVQLFHNFTYFMNDAEHGDQFEQYERRWTAGGRVTHRRLLRLGGRPAETAAGVEVRHDRVSPLGLHLTTATRRRETVRLDMATQTSAAGFGEVEVEWSRTVRTTVGLRGNVYRWDVQSDLPANSGQAAAGLLNPKFSSAFGPWRGTEIYVNAGTGFHSNAGLGIMLTTDPLTGEPTTASPPFAQARGVEAGVRTVALRRTQLTATVWYLGFDSELVYVGDSGSTEAGPASRRAGVELTGYVYPTERFALDLDVSFSRARYIGVPGDEAYVPGALNRVITGGLTLAPPGAGRAATGPFGSLRLRHFGPRPLTEGGLVTSRATTILNAEAGWQLSGRWRVFATGFNLLNQRVSDIDYYYASRLRDEPAAVEDVHFHPAIPRSARLTLQASF
ncbi:MAG: methylated-DNA--[protein]-cysteine S-methyltransferase [Vicinamibacterales bacterium]